MIQDKKKIKSLEKAFKLWQEGKSFREIFNIFPKDQKELKELFKVAQLVKKEKSEIKPSKEILKRILSQIDVPDIREEKNRSSISQLLAEMISNFVRQKTYLLTGVTMIIIVLVTGFYLHSQKLAALPGKQETIYEKIGSSQNIVEVDISEIEILENELAVELNGLTNDLADLSGLEGDAALDDLEASLLFIIE